jgi:hypothetical protein
LREVDGSRPVQGASRGPHRAEAEFVLARRVRGGTPCQLKLSYPPFLPKPFDESSNILKLYLIEMERRDTGTVCECVLILGVYLDAFELTLPKLSEAFLQKSVWRTRVETELRKAPRRVEVGRRVITEHRAAAPVSRAWLRWTVTRRLTLLVPGRSPRARLGPRSGGQRSLSLLE